MYRTQMELVKRFEDETDNTIKSFNDIFLGSPILYSNMELTLEIGELTRLGMRSIKLSDGNYLENELNFYYTNKSSESIKNSKHIYMIDDEFFKSKKQIKSRYPLLTYMDITDAVDLGTTVFKYGGITIERRNINA